jgi:hypothetical protein
MFSTLKQLRPIPSAMSRLKSSTKQSTSFVDDSTLDWENFLSALMLSYNTSYHSTIAMMPFELLF